MASYTLWLKWWKKHVLILKDLKVLSDDISVSQANVWAVEWLWDYLPPERLSSFLQEITQEVENTTGVWAPSLDNQSMH